MWNRRTPTVIDHGKRRLFLNGSFLVFDLNKLMKVSCFDTVERLAIVAASISVFTFEGVIPLIAMSAAFAKRC